ncbi:hypothetical protein AAC387_Pa03g0345 [Persea americana]
MTRLSEDHGNPPTFTSVSTSIARKFDGSVRSAGSRGTTLRLGSSTRSASLAIQLGSSDKECQLIVSTQQLGSSVQSASSAGGSSASVPAESQLSQTETGPAKSMKAKSGPSHLPKARACPDS